MLLQTPLLKQQTAQHGGSLSKGYIICMLISLTDIAPACLSISQINYIPFPFPIPLVVSPRPATFFPHSRVTDFSNLLMISARDPVGSQSQAGSKPPSTQALQFGSSQCQMCLTFPVSGHSQVPATTIQPHFSCHIHCCFFTTSHAPIQSCTRDGVTPRSSTKRSRL